MNCKIESPSYKDQILTQSDPQEVLKIKQDLLKKLEDFPYENIHLENDQELAELIYTLGEEIGIDLNSSLVSKNELIEKINKSINPEPKPFLNPAVSVCNLFELASTLQESKKAEHFKSLQAINADLDLLGALVGHFQNSSLDQKVDFNQNSDIKILIDKAQTKFGFPISSKPYVWENKQEVISFLTQKTKELTHRSQETMLHLQHSADKLKSMVDITKNILDEDAKLKDTIIKRSAG
jgi:hypothetical protein